MKYQAKTTNEEKEKKKTSEQETKLVKENYCKKGLVRGKKNYKQK